MNGPPRIIAIGNPLRGDDAAGLEVARRLGAAGFPAARLCVNHGDAAALLDLLRDQAAVLFIDASRTGAAPGSIVRIDASDTPLPTGFTPTSSHGFGLADAIELARALDVLPPSVQVIGIEGARFTHGAPLSGVVADAVDRIVVEVLAASRTEPQRA